MLIVSDLQFPALDCVPGNQYVYVTAVFLFVIHECSDGAVGVGVEFLHILAPFYFVVSIKLITDGVLRGVGAMKQFMVTTFLDLFLRVILAALFSREWGSTGIWLAWPVGWTIGTSASMVLYRIVVRGLKRKKMEEVTE